MMRERVRAWHASEQSEKSGIFMQRSAPRTARVIFLSALLFSGYARHEALADLSTDREATQEIWAAVPGNEISPGETLAPVDFIVPLAGNGLATAECFQLRPGAIGRKGEKSRRCEPQSLPFARCRSGIDSCRLGHENGPLTWFACEQQRGNTSVEPQRGSILILAANGRRKMATGHVAYVEEVVAQSTTVYRLIFTHTNYDRRCSLESHIEATYDSVARTLDIHTGAWQAWGKRLPVAGFILE